MKIVNNLIIEKEMGMFKVKSDVAGTVWKLEVQVGQTVAEGDTLLVAESMKMEIPVSAPRAGVVADILVAEGDTLAEDQWIVTLN